MEVQSFMLGAKLRLKELCLNVVGYRIIGVPLPFRPEGGFVPIVTVKIRPAVSSRVPACVKRDIC